MKTSAWLLVALLLVGASAARADEKTCAIKFLVVKADNGKPVRNAPVVVHQIDKDGRQSKGGMELKTDPEGRADLPVAPCGKLRVQVLAPRFQTYGQDFDVDQPTQELVVKLKRPQSQYSIYENNKKEDAEKPKQEEKPKQDQKPK